MAHNWKKQFSRPHKENEDMSEVKTCRMSEYVDYYKDIYKDFRKN
jgi:hypothetical protein